MPFSRATSALRAARSSGFGATTASAACVGVPSIRITIALTITPDKNAKLKIRNRDCDMFSPIDFATTSSWHHITTMRIPLLLSLFALVSYSARADDYFPPPDSEGGWRMPKDAAETRELAGMDPHRL